MGPSLLSLLWMEMDTLVQVSPGPMALVAMAHKVCGRVKFHHTLEENPDHYDRRDVVSDESVQEFPSSLREPFPNSPAAH